MKQVLTLAFLFLILPALAQDKQDEKIISAIFSEALIDYTAYHQLEWLCTHTAGRICGTPEAAAAVEYTYQTMLNMELDSVWKQPVMVRNWKRGEPEQGRIVSSLYGTTEVPVCALGTSVGTGEGGVVAEVVEVQNFIELAALAGRVKGKIVFFNRPMDPTEVNTFAAYGGAVNQRTSGAAMAAKLGAVASIVRSMNTELDDYPHTGVTRYENEKERIPAFAISTNGAELLSLQLSKDPTLKLYLRSTCQNYPDVLSYNVIGEIRGSEYPEKIITIGGHLDAWDTGEGAHDDGAGCIQAIEVLRLFRKMGVEPKHTIRAVMFMDEEVAQRGGQAYAREAELRGEQHVAAVESDRGVLTPKAVTIGSDDARFKKAASWEKLFEPYGLKLEPGGGGVDISPLRKLNPDLVYLGYLPDNQRYFRFHHSPFDRFDQVDRREMQMGAAAIASMVYLYDRYGL